MNFEVIGANIVKILSKYWRVFLIEGLSVTLELAFISVLLGVLLGTVVAMLKMSRFKLVRALISVYVEVIRGTPILLQLYIFVFALPSSVGLATSRPRPSTVPRADASMGSPRMVPVPWASM